MSSIFGFLSKNIPWVIEALLPALIIYIAFKIGFNNDFDGMISSLVFIVAFSYLMLHNRKVMLRKAFLTTLTVVWIHNGVIAAINALPNSDSLNIILNVILSLMTTIGEMSTEMKIGLVAICAVLAVCELFVVDWLLSDKPDYKKRLGLTITSKDCNEEKIWWFTRGTDRVNDKLVEVISFSCKVSISNQHSDKIYHLKEVLKNIRLSTQFWGSMSFLHKNVVINNNNVKHTNYSKVPFKRGEPPTDVVITWDMRQELRIIGHSVIGHLTNGIG